VQTALLWLIYYTVAFYYIWSGNGAGLFSKEKIGKGGDKYGKSREKKKRKK